MAARSQMDCAERARADAAIAQRLGVWLAGRQPGVLALWWPLPGEPDLRPAFAELQAAGWIIALPRVVGPGQALIFGRWSSAVEMVEEAHRVRVPRPFEPLDPDLIVAPCVGFDPRGWRLGYGAGYYDRTLSALDVPALGVGYEVCEAAFEPEPHDRRLTAIITERRFLAFDPAGPTPGGVGTNPPSPDPASRR